jgi:hypothetical protein
MSAQAMWSSWLSSPPGLAGHAGLASAAFATGSSAFVSAFFELLLAALAPAFFFPFPLFLPIVNIESNKPKLDSNRY